MCACATFAAFFIYKKKLCRDMRVARSLAALLLWHRQQSGGCNIVRAYDTLARACLFSLFFDCTPPPPPPHVGDSIHLTPHSLMIR